MTETSTPADAVQSKRLSPGRVLELLGPFLGLLIVTGLFGVLAPDSFLSLYNFKTIATQTVIVGLGAIGMTFVIVGGGIDLSVGSVIALASVVTAVLLRDGSPPIVAILGGAVSGGAVGVFNGLLVARLGIIPFIVTLGTMGIARGVSKYLADEQKVDAPMTWISEVMAKTPEPSWLLLSPGIWLLFGVGLVMGLTLRFSVFGTYTFAVGSNEDTARLSGLRVPRIKLVLYMLCGTFAGLAGVMQFARLTVGDPTTAVGKELDVIAAVVIGGGSLAGGNGSILGSLIGAFLMSTLANGCTLTGVPNYVQEILIGAIIIVAVAVDRLRQAKR